MVDISNMRREYAAHELTEATAENDPVDQFQQWFAEAVEAKVPDLTAMTLATTTPDGRPSARIVLLKDVSSGGFDFYTNYNSRKAREIETNHHVALVFWWQVLDRQIRVEGTVSRLTREANEAYFALRPRDSQLSAWASSQSEVLEGRMALEERLNELRETHEGSDVPCPPHWGGYRVAPEAMEFWQGRRGRLHDRLRYTRSGDDWTIERLAP